MSAILSINTIIFNPLFVQLVPICNYLLSIVCKYLHTLVNNNIYIRLLLSKFRGCVPLLLKKDNFVAAL